MRSVYYDVLNKAVAHQILLFIHRFAVIVWLESFHLHSQNLSIHPTKLLPFAPHSNGILSKLNCFNN